MDKFFKPRSVTKAGKDVDDDDPQEEMSNTSSDLHTSINIFFLSLNNTNIIKIFIASNIYNDHATVSSPNVDDPVLVNDTNNIVSTSTRTLGTYEY